MNLKIRNEIKLTQRPGCIQKLNPVEFFGFSAEEQEPIFGPEILVVQEARTVKTQQNQDRQIRI